MARIRYIKPEFYSDTKLSDVSIEARYFYAGLFCQFDKQGICEDDAKLLKREIFPYDDHITIKRIEMLIEELVNNGRLIRFPYQGKDYLYCATLSRHQKFHKDEKPKYLIPIDAILAPSQQGANPVPTPCRPRLTQVLGALVTGNGELVTETETEIHAVVKTPAASNLPERVEIGVPAPKNSKFSDSTREKMRAFIATYAKGYKEKYNGSPEGIKDKALIGKLGHWIESVSEVRAISLVEVYLQISYRPFDENYHDLWQFFRHLNRIGVALDTGKDANSVDWTKVFSGGSG